ncbi:Cna B-type domain-containing protein [Clostridium sp. AL.422]|uniref:Cna B-type domain-containing protein n=1 Tax=Clostridium TaxID=1485 RepID=UPI00293DB6BA|nr:MULTISPECIES: Cna B-type domain-containing protein [unclassified Clostridium]MDV4150137.1 Cna B-type domain-containing protein [Clostridium sp. AL.422]
MVKRVISSILSVTFLTSCITFSSNGSRVKADDISTLTSNRQIVYSGESNTIKEDNVTTSKIIEETGTENVFDITLQVTTQEDIRNISISPDAATVLVLDRSGSMERTDGDSTSRFKEMQDAANAFLTQYAKVESGSSAKRLVSIVSFSSDVKNETYDSRNNVNNWINVVSDLNKATEIIDDLDYPVGGTNIEGGLIMANNIIADGKNKETLKGITNINIILLTDGCPTFHASSNTDSLNTIKGVEGGSNVAFTSDWKPVGGTVNNISANSSNISKTIKENGINLYTIAFSTQDAIFYTEDPDKDDGHKKQDNNGVYVDLNPSTWMATFATRNFLANNASELSQQFTKINQLIALSAKAWKVSDPMGDNITYSNVIDENSNNAYSFDKQTNTLNWDLKSSTPAISPETVNGATVTTYTYTLKYRVTLDTTNKGYSYNSVDTNKTTTLDYYLFSTQNNTQSVELKHTNFYIPKVKGLFGEFSFTKVDENNDAMKDVTFTLTGTATGSEKSVVMSTTSYSDGKVSFTNIPAGEYTLTETAPDGYVQPDSWKVVVSYGNVTKDSKLGDRIVNYPTYRDISVKKVWDLPSDKKYELPENVTIKLYANNKDTGKTLVLSGSNKWTGSFDKLHYLDENGVVINYSIEEVEVAGYNKPSISRSKDGNEFTITNEYNPERIEISGTKNWVDSSGNPIQGTVPKIKITLQRTTSDKWENVKTITLAHPDTQYTFENLEKTATNSKEYKYRVREAEVKGYEPTYDENLDITNTYTPGETELTVNKVWENVNIESDTLPEVRLILYQDGKVYDNTKVLNEETGYTYKYTSLPKYATTGDEYKYTVKEEVPVGTVGYSSTQNINSDGSVTITNTFNTERVNITGVKNWVNVPKGAIVPSVTLRLYQNGVEINSITLGSGVKVSDSYVFEDLPKYSTDGTEYVYTVIEDTINGYESSGEGNDSNKYVINNTFANEKVTVMGQKNWSGVEDTSIVPTITVTLESSLDGDTWTPVEGMTKVLAAGESSYKFEDLPKYSLDSREYKYRVVESPVNGYVSSNNGDYNILNTYTPGETSVKVTKTWTNVNPDTDTVPKVTILLKQNGTNIDSIVLDKENNYTHTFKGLAKYAPTGEAYEYTVDEVLEDGIVGYSKQITSGNDGFVVDNIFDTTDIDITFNKVWEGIAAGDEVPSITLHLYQNGVELEDKVITLDGGIKGNRRETYVFEDLPKYSTDGKEYVYTVKEDSITAYESSGEANASNNYTITNTYTPGSISIDGEKTWSGEGVTDEVPTITIRLENSIDGETWALVEGKVVELTAGNTEYRFDNLPEYASNGMEYKYRVVEDKVKGYEPSYDEDYNITNIYTPGVTSVKVTKKWTNVDPNNDKVPEVKIILKKNGEEVDSIVLNKFNDYTHTFEDLDRYAPTGDAYVYTVEEVLADEVKGYTNEITSGAEGFVVENIFDPGEVDITFTKVWKNISEDIEVPAITLHLYQSGVELEDKVITLAGGVKEGGRETYVFKDLPEYSTDGTRYVYTIIEDRVDGYIPSGIAEALNNYTITNTYYGGEKIAINGTKTWVNVENINKVPDITIRVLRDGEEIHNIVVPSGTRKYEIALDNMVKYAPDGHEYVYELTEDKIEGFESEREGYNFTNTKIIEEGVSGISDINIGGSNSNINTGDNSMMILYASLAVISLSLISMITLRKRRKTIEK